MNWVEKRAHLERVLLMRTPELWRNLCLEMQRSVECFERCYTSDYRATSSMDVFHESFSVQMNAIQGTRTKSLRLIFDVSRTKIGVERTDPPASYEMILQPMDDETVTLLMDGKPCGVELVARTLLEPFLFADNATALRRSFVDAFEATGKPRAADPNIQ